MTKLIYGVFEVILGSFMFILFGAILFYAMGGIFVVWYGIAMSDWLPSLKIVLYVLSLSFWVGILLGIKLGGF